MFVTGGMLQRLVISSAGKPGCVTHLYSAIQFYIRLINVKNIGRALEEEKNFQKISAPVF